MWFICSLLQLQSFFRYQARKHASRHLKWCMSSSTSGVFKPLLLLSQVVYSMALLNLWSWGFSSQVWVVYFNCITTSMAINVTNQPRKSLLIMEKILLFISKNHVQNASSNITMKCASKKKTLTDKTMSTCRDRNFQRFQYRSHVASKIFTSTMWERLMGMPFITPFSVSTIYYSIHIGS